MKKSIKRMLKLILIPPVFAIIWCVVEMVHEGSLSIFTGILAIIYMGCMGFLSHTGIDSFKE